MRGNEFIRSTSCDCVSPFALCSAQKSSRDCLFFGDFICLEAVDIRCSAANTRARGSTSRTVADPSGQRKHSHFEPSGTNRLTHEGQESKISVSIVISSIRFGQGPKIGITDHRCHSSIAFAKPKNTDTDTLYSAVRDFIVASISSSENSFN